MAVLEKHNFEITRIDPHANYDLVWGYSGSNAKLSLRQGRDIIIQVDAHRYIADVIPTRHEAADRSIDRFDEALGQMLND